MNTAMTAVYYLRSAGDYSVMRTIKYSYMQLEMFEYFNEQLLKEYKTRPFLTVLVSDLSGSFIHPFIFDTIYPSPFCYIPAHL